MADDSRFFTRDDDYFTRRESQERLAAEQASDPAAKRVHATLAEGYAERLRATMPATS